MVTYLFILLAQEFKRPLEGFDSYPSPIGKVTDLEGPLKKSLVWVMGIFWVLAVVFLIWAAFLFLTAGGEEEKITKAKKIILYAVIAGIVALLATGINIILFNLLKGNV